MISIYDSKAFEQYFREKRWNPHLIRKVRNAYFKKQKEGKEIFASLSSEQALELEKDLDLHPLVLKHRYDSEKDGAIKLIFETKEGYLIESVILRYESGRTSLCLSSQVGCAANCSFCATGKMKIVHNLSAGEILDQVAWAQKILASEKRRVRNLVFMGMGEPLHNENNLYSALEVLHSPQFFDLSARQTIVSTVGIPEKMKAFGDKFPHVGLALSLHSARQEIREEIVPLARKYHLEELKEAIKYLLEKQEKPIMIEYLMLKGINDQEEDLEALSHYLEGIPAYINLIPYNPITLAPKLESSSVDVRKRFAQVLKERGFRVALRYSFGADIEAACGQLVQLSNRERKMGKR